MNNVIIGTAGHVDHGKTSLIKALTGINTDRLKEEKKRGITIELGFAHLDFDDGTKVGIVDVPGHEKFVKNMLAGAGGIDIALLIVAANEGIMPQTVEHFEILKLLNISKGIVVITKTDMVEPDWLDMIRDDVRAFLKGSSLENAPIMEVSVYAGKGIDELKQSLHAMVKEAELKDLNVPFRIPVDRVFSIDGFGTVITGTLIEGKLDKGDLVNIFPMNAQTKVRNIQVHDTDVETAYAGQRVAVNLASVKRDSLERGSVIAAPASMSNTFMVDVYLEILPDCGRIVKNNSKVHLYHGSRDILCKIVLLDKDELKPGEKGYAQLRFDEEAAMKYGDRYIIRFYSPLETIGGGIILNPNPNKHPRHKSEILNNLETLRTGTASERIGAFIKEKTKDFPEASYISMLSGSNAETFSKEIESLVKNKNVVSLDNRYVIDISHYKSIISKTNIVLEKFHKENPYKKGMNIEEFKSKISRGVPEGAMPALIKTMQVTGIIDIDSLLVAKHGFGIKTDGAYTELASKIEKVYKDAGVMVPSRDEVLKMFNDKNKIKVMDSLISENKLIMIDKQMLFHHEVFSDCVEKLKGFVKENGEITLAQFRDIIGASRKYAIALLEYCDGKKITKKIGDSRVAL